MASCGFGAPTGDQPWGHGIENGEMVAVAPGPLADNPPALGPAGTVHCSLADWGKFLAVHLAATRGKPTLLSAESMARLHTPPAGGDYAAGWFIIARDWAGGTALMHDGTNTGWYADAWLAPAKNTTIVAVTNEGGEDAWRALDSVFAPLIARYADAAGVSGPACSDDLPPLRGRPSPNSCNPAR